MLLIDIKDKELTQEEVEMLEHPFSFRANFIHP
ncbi:Uncharacterised protein [Mannheimia haemolytica]|uniref:Uncharacterized protein n=1 Tax=Mannheimia haemolytica TaxID=75985 RepID=A0A378MX27_MANHA|nr:Uncharacterised protein [Mannheimia haemolytica]